MQLPTFVFSFCRDKYDHQRIAIAVVSADKSKTFTIYIGGQSSRTTLKIDFQPFFWLNYKSIDFPVSMSISFTCIQDIGSDESKYF